jgi:hypothetical protein
VDIVTRNLVTTRFIYEYFSTGVNFTPSIETEFPAVDYSIVFTLSGNFIPSDCRMTTYLAVNDVIPNSYKLYKHKITRASPVCTTCNNLENNIHWAKQCMGSRKAWTWLTITLQNRLGLDITDPEEQLVMKGNYEEVAGLWFTLVTKN